MDEGTEHHKHEKGVNKTIVYVGIAASLILLVLLFVYSSNQFNSLNEKLSAQADVTTANRLTALENKVNELEKVLTQYYKALEVPLKLYYDSECTFCNNVHLLDLAQTLANELEKQQIELQVIDIKGDASVLDGSGIQRLPAFYAATEHIIESENLNNFMVLLRDKGYDMGNGPDSLLALEPQNSELLFSECRNENKVVLEQFCSDTNPFCKRVYDVNGTLKNPSNTTRFEKVTEEELSGVLEEFGDLMDYKYRCIIRNFEIDNLIELGINKSDEQICKENYGQAVFNEAENLVTKYFIYSTPRFVVDCKYGFIALNAEEIKKNVCRARGDICAKLP